MRRVGPCSSSVSSSSVHIPCSTHHFTLQWVAQTVISTQSRTQTHGITATRRVTRHKQCRPTSCFTPASARFCLQANLRTVKAQSSGLGWCIWYSDSLRAGRSGDRIPSRPPWGPSSLLHYGYRDFPGAKRPGRGVDQPPPSSPQVKESAEL